MLTFENVLEIFHEYLLHDPEEEVLPANAAMSDCLGQGFPLLVDGILCRTPEELFDILLTDFQDFADLPDAGTPGGYRGGRKGRRGTVPAIPGLAEGGAEMRAVLFILKLGLKILAAPVVLALMLFTWLCFGLLYVSSFIFGLASTVVALLGIAVLVTYSPQNGVILLVIAFLVSPLGLPMAAAGWWARCRTCGMRSRTRCMAE